MWPERNKKSKKMKTEPNKKENRKPKPNQNQTCGNATKKKKQDYGKVFQYEDLKSQPSTTSELGI